MKKKYKNNTQHVRLLSILRYELLKFLADYSIIIIIDFIPWSSTIRYVRSFESRPIEFNGYLKQYKEREKEKDHNDEIYTEMYFTFKETICIVDDV